MGHKSWITSVAFGPDGRFALTGSNDTTTRLWKIKSVDKVLSVADTLLMLKLTENEDQLAEDCEAINRLQLIANAASQHPLITKHIAGYFV